MAKLYNCAKCPGYCCSYARIIVNNTDIRRLARHFGVTEDVARERFTKKGAEPNERILRHQEDPHYKTICRFFDQEKRCCSIYEARPRICREFPGEGRCGYYDFLTFERNAQDDPEWVSTTGN